MSVEDDVMCVRDPGNPDLICMFTVFTFLLSINNCLTKSLASILKLVFKENLHWMISSVLYSRFYMGEETESCGNAIQR